MNRPNSDMTLPNREMTFPQSRRTRPRSRRSPASHTGIHVSCEAIIGERFCIDAARKWAGMNAHCHSRGSSGGGNPDDREATAGSLDARLRGHDGQDGLKTITKRPIVTRKAIEGPFPQVVFPSHRPAV